MRLVSYLENTLHPAYLSIFIFVSIGIVFFLDLIVDLDHVASRQTHSIHERTQRLYEIFFY